MLPSTVTPLLPVCSKCACVAARYELREVFDNLIISLCKFTTLLHTHEVRGELWSGLSCCFLYVVNYAKDFWKGLFGAYHL